MLFGREKEQAAVASLLDAARHSRGGARVLRGHPGVGKTAVLQDARDHASDMRVLSARGVEAESDLPFAGLHQLILPALHLLDRLPGPQGIALRGALGLADAPRNERFLISSAALTLLSELSQQQPVLCLVDDAQWIDAPSADVLLFVARRLDAEAIAMLFTARETDDHPFEARDIESIELSELDRWAAAALLDARVGDIASNVRDLIVEQSGGNALALVELPTALSREQLLGGERLPQTLPLTRDAERLFADRVHRLSEAAQQLLLVIAADDSGQLSTVLTAAEALGIAGDTLEEAERTGIISIEGGAVEVRHPLVRSAVYQRAQASRRRAVHLALADALDEELESDRRAWHRATAAFGPDAQVADELERTAERARLRSGYASAATALQRAAELSVDLQSQTRRLVGAATSAWHAGEPDRASQLLDRVGSMAVEASSRAEIALVRGEIQFQSGSLLDACDTLMTGAADITSLDPHKALEMLRDAANASENAGDYIRFGEALKRASDLPRSDDDIDRALRHLVVGVGGILEGRTEREVPLISESLARADDIDDPIWLLWAAFGAEAIGDAPRGAELLRRAIGLARASAAVDMLTRALLVQTVQGVFACRSSMEAEAAEGLRLSRDAGLRNTMSAFHAILAWFGAIKGRVEECRAHAASALEHARPNGMALASSIAEWAISLLDLTGGRPGDALDRLALVAEGQPGMRHPYVTLVFTPDLVEACVRVGRPDQAHAAMAGFEPFAGSGMVSWAAALAARCRALLASGEEAETEFINAMQLHSGGNRLFDRARTALLYGEFLRRERRRADAREQLRAAVDGFEELGAEPWAKRARAELRASGETARRRDPSTVGRLTPQELQIAHFVGEGLTNKEVAALLFLSPRTIDYHLRNVFSKLGITSRTQLVRMSLHSDDSMATASATAMVDADT